VALIIERMQGIEDVIVREGAAELRSEREDPQLCVLALIVQRRDVKSHRAGCRSRSSLDLLGSIVRHDV
jgi:hypothetical protein